MRIVYGRVSCRVRSTSPCLSGTERRAEPRSSCMLVQVKHTKAREREGPPVTHTQVQARQASWCVYFYENRQTFPDSIEFEKRAVRDAELEEIRDRQ